ncbi:murein biosynthesis integral membrane protein MurJ [Paenibacillus whitsoniae]|uniref:Probable lipid II flippase MurJ n=1 Tax=Paenibacillus whitsoniae TaxID=2496558 RepID=A0A3S0BTN5_9BACL|nr:murein biosynthesis integral membrane protein MurJ [Paenibacillus whitsoniae]RTE08117.1 murein biosynthesis integral membrane protein MurJ [Paenibacillus whitsoniae]
METTEKRNSANHMSLSAIWLFGAIVIGRMLGFIRESALAYVFGASPEVDAFIVAQTITFLLFSFLGPAIWNAGIPVLTDLFAKDQSRHRRQYRNTVWSFFHLIVIVTGLFMVIGYFITPALIHLVAPGFDSYRDQMAIHLTRAMLPVILFFGLAGWASLVLQSQNRFGSYAMSYLPNNLISIAGILMSAFTGNILLVAVATMLGIAGQFLVQLPGLFSTKYKLSFNLKNAEFVKIMKLAPSTIFTEMGNQLNTVFDRIFGSGLQAGSIASLGYGQRAFNLVTGVIQMPIIIVLFPKLSAQSATGDNNGFVRLLGKGLGLLSYLMIPAAAGLMMLSVPITQLLFERGAFESSATLVTASIVFFYAISLPFLSWRDLLIRSFYAMKDSKTPVTSTIVMVVANVGLNFLIVPLWGVKALAISSTFGVVVSTLFSYAVIRFRFKMYMAHIRIFYEAIVKSVLATAGMVGVVYLTSEFSGIRFTGREDMSSLRLALSVVMVIALAAISYVAFSFLLRSKENMYCFSVVRGYLDKVLSRLTRKMNILQTKRSGEVEASDH